MNPALPDVRKIAVLRPSAVGDFVFALPALHAFRNTYPEAQIVYIGKQWHADFLKARPGPVDRVAVMPPTAGVGAPPDALLPEEPGRQFIAAMQREQFDLAVQLFGGGRYSNPYVAALGAGLCIGLKAADAAPLDKWVPYGGLANTRLRLLEVAELAGARAWHAEHELSVTGSDRLQAARVLPVTAQRLVLLQPGSSDARRCWPPAHFAAVGDALAQDGALVAVNGTAHEAPLVRAVVKAMRHRAIDLSGELSLSGLCGLLERCALLISNDTGPLHLGLAIGTPCVGIYWFTNLIESAPLRQQRHRGAMSHRVHCPVCGAENLKTRCAHDASFVADVRPDEVIALAIELLRSTA